MKTRIAERGERLNDLIVIEYIKGTRAIKARYLVKCKCGMQYKVLSFHLINGTTKRCKRCANKLMVIHNKNRYKYAEIIPDDKLRRMWLIRHRGMFARCYDPSAVNYPDYGGRGIKVCDRWHDKFVFLVDIVRLKGWYNMKMQLDRTNNHGNYSPQNCKMVSPSENCLNRRTSLKNRAEREQEEIEDEKPW